MPPQETENNPFMSLFLGVPEKFVYDKDMNERDCLNCNIFMPASAVGSSEELPVLVWIHGGGMRNGANSVPLYGMFLVFLSTRSMLLFFIKVRSQCTNVWDVKK